ncbi:MAG: pyridoxamine 5'-phosphate oxidase family protein [Peptococcales bacterium]
MFRKMRRSDKELKNGEVFEILKKSDFGILSTFSQNGYPYGVPIHYAYINETIYFHCAEEGHKLDNIRNNDKVSFCVAVQNQILPDEFSTKYQSVIVFGRAIEVSDEEKYMALLEILNKYSPDYIEQGKEYIQKNYEVTKVIKIKVEHISGKARK